MQPNQSSSSGNSQPQPAPQPVTQPALPKPIAPTSQPQPPREMPKPIAQVELSASDKAGGETLDQTRLTEMLKKADQVRLAAPLDHPPIDISAPKPGNVITPGTKQALPSMTANPSKPPVAPTMPNAAPKLMPASPAVAPLAKVAPTPPPINAFMAPDIRQLQKPTPAPAVPPASAKLADTPKPTFLEPDDMPKAQPPSIPAAPPKSKKPSPFKRSAGSLIYLLEDGLSALAHLRLGARMRAASAGGILAGLFVICLLIFVIPSSRYAIGGLLVKKTYAVKVIDSDTGDPLSFANVSAGSARATTDANGIAKLNGIKPGKHNMSVSLPYFSAKTIQQTVPLIGGKEPQPIELSATGNLIEVSLTNTITNQPLAGAMVKAGNSRALAAGTGKALVAVAPGSGLQPVDISLAGFNPVSATLSVVEGGVATTTQSLTPAGRVYYLAHNSSGADIVGSRLDGSSAKTILPASGHESSEAELLTSPDNKYLALRAKRTEDPHAQLYITTVDGNDTAEIAHGPAQFSLYGWLGDTLIYSATYDNLKPWQKGTTVLSSYDAQTRKTATIFTSEAVGNAAAWGHQTLPYVMLVGGSVIYGSEWVTSPSAPAGLTASKSNSLNIAMGDGTNQQVIASVNAATYGLIYKQNSPISLYIKRVAWGGGADHFFTYRFGDSQSSPALIKAAQFDQNYPQYFFSPDDKLTFWSQSGNLLLGDNQGQRPIKILENTNYRPQGWYNISYLLVTNGKGLYIMGTGGSTPYKISSNYIGH